MLLKDKEGFYQLLLVCKDKRVRNDISRLLLNAINIAIEYRNFDLDEAKFDSMPKEDKNDIIDANELFTEEYFIIIFLDEFLELMPTKVAKNWFRFASYFKVCHNKKIKSLLICIVLEALRTVGEGTVELHAGKRFNRLLL